MIAFQLKKNEKQANLKPVTPSKIPVGSFRVEEEKAINRALTGSGDSNRRSSERTVSPTPPSRIPKFFGANYKKVQVEKV